VVDVTSGTKDDKPKVFANDPIQSATENRRDAVHTAIAQLRSGPAHSDPLLRALNCRLAVDVLTKSVQRCVILDNRPLDPDRVLSRANAALAMLNGQSDPGQVA
jgi:hypothetical protein